MYGLSLYVSLSLQLHAAISNQVDPDRLGLGLGSVLLNNLKQTIVVLASNAGVLNTVQAAAQAVLQSGWSVLLPTAEERARALSSLLPNTGEHKTKSLSSSFTFCGCFFFIIIIENRLKWRHLGLHLNFLFPASGNEMSVSPGRRFMIDLLVSSLMADGGLESALNAAITAEIQVSVLNVHVHFLSRALKAAVNQYIKNTKTSHPNSQPLFMSCFKLLLLNRTLKPRRRLRKRRR